MDKPELWFLFLGGVSYSVGAVIYAFKKPNILPNRVGFHGVFHVFILLGAFMHFMVVVIAINRELYT
jgi:hemolysin III